jgi:hypothetical protein
MNKEIFKENLLKCLTELLDNKEYSIDKCKFIVNPISEDGKKLNSTDDYMRLTVLSKKNTQGRQLSIEKVVKLFSGLAPLYPIWINVYLENINEDGYLIKLDTSLRFRKPSLLQNQEYGYPPFKGVKK